MIASKLLVNSYRNKSHINHDYFDKSLSTVNTKIYHDKNTGSLVVTERGTKNLINDIPTDLLLLTGQLHKSDRIKKAQKTVDEAIQKFNPKKISLLGHSLGGSINEHIKVPHNIQHQLISFNKGSDLYNNKNYVNKNHINLRTNNDLISFFNKRTSKTIKGDGHQLTNRNQHSLDSYINNNNINF